MPQFTAFASLAATAVVCLLAGWWASRRRNEQLHGQVREVRERLLQEARAAAEATVKAAELEAKAEYFAARGRFEAETEAARGEGRRRLEIIDQREENLDKKVAFIDQKEARLEQMDESLRRRLEETERRDKESEALQRQQTETLERIAGLSAERARQELMEKMVADARHAAARSVQQVREETERHCRRESMKIISLAVQRYAAEHVAESTVSVVDLPSDDMKGRIIGREGRNIRAFELATGIDVIIDDTPGAVIVSGFDPVRREVARQSLATPGARRAHPSGPHRGGGAQDRRGDAREACARSASRPAWTWVCSRYTRNCTRTSAACTTAPATARTCSSIRRKWRRSRR